MFAGKAIRCDCGYEVHAEGEDALVAAVRRHALEAHGIDFSVELARKIARGGLQPAGERSSRKETK